MPARPAGWRVIRDRYNRFTREIKAAAAASRPAPPEPAQRPARAPKPKPVPKERRAPELAPCGHPTVAECARGWHPYQPCRECGVLLAADPSCGPLASCAMPGFPPCDRSQSENDRSLKGKSPPLGE
jgi:hypothetical protein